MEILIKLGYNKSTLIRGGIGFDRQFSWKETDFMINRALQRQLREWERLNEKEQLLNPQTRAAYIRRKRERQKIEALGREYQRKKRALG